MGYTVRFVEDDRLPADIDWSLIRDGEGFYFVVKENKISAQICAEAWAAYRMLTQPVRPRLRLAN